MSAYSNLTPKTLTEGVDRALDAAEETLSRLISQEDRDFENTVRPLDRIADILDHANADFTFMGYVHPEREVRSAAKDGEERLQKWASDIYFRDDLNSAITAYADSDEAKSLTGGRKRLLEFTLRDLRRAGHGLDPQTRQRVRDLTQKLVELEVRFQQNIDEWDDWILVERADLEGMPDSFIEGLGIDEESGRFRVTIAYPEMVPFLQNSPRRDLREQLRFKFNTIAAEENRKLLTEALDIRQEIAEAFGLPSWAHHRLELRMAKTPERVTEMYDELIEPLTNAARKELTAIAALLEEDTGDNEVQQWDWSYYDTQQRKSDYGVDNFEVAKYFPLPQVLKGMFELTSEMFGVTYHEVEEFDSWHPDVQLFALHDADGGEEISRFYLDLFPREGKYGHAAEFPLIRGRALEDGTYQNPLCAMVANFTKPGTNSPSLLLHSEVETLFHEFGHVLHQNLARTEFATFSGTQTERDFVEAPSQIMEHWIWNADVLKRFARHYETNDPIPTELVDQLVAARRLNKAMHQLRQIQYGWWDQQIHAGRDRDLDAIHDEGCEISMLPAHPGTFPLASFGHVMGGYDASYYGYMWAEVFGDDMFSRFEEDGVTNPEVGRAYRGAILSKGGALDAEKMLVDFLGREPNNEAFLRKLGISGTA